MMSKGLFFSLLLISARMVTSHLDAISVKPLVNRRLDVTPQDVVTRSSKIKCTATCRVTSWCVSANLAPDRSTCQLLSAEVSAETSLETAEGWTFIRKLYQGFMMIMYTINLIPETEM